MQVIAQTAMPVWWVLRIPTQILPLTQVLLSTEFLGTRKAEAGRLAFKAASAM